MESVRIFEQPAEYYRFRYEKEKDSVSKLTGRSNKNSVPSIEINVRAGEVLIIISCVTEHAPHRPHPFSVVDRSKIKDKNFVNKGVYMQRTLSMNCPQVVEFKNIGIVCAPNGRLEEVLQHRKRINVDPYRTGFKDFLSEFKSERKGSTAVRLCFQVLVAERNSEWRPLKPIVSDVIRANRKLIIDHVSQSSGPSYTQTSITIVCSKVRKEDIEVVFFDNDGGDPWEETASVIHVFREHSIVCYTPLYKNIKSSGQVFIKLRRKSDNLFSNYVKFVYTNSQTLSKTISNSLLSEEDQEDRIRQPLDIRDPAKPIQAENSSRQNLASCPSLAILKQEKDQSPRSIPNLSKLLEWSNGNNQMPKNEYTDSKPTTSGMYFSLPEIWKEINNYVNICFHSISCNAISEVASERKVSNNTSAKGSSWQDGTEESIKHGPICYDNNNQVKTQEMHPPTPLESTLPSFENLKHSFAWSKLCLNRPVRQYYSQEQQSFVQSAHLSHQPNGDQGTEIENILSDPNLWLDDVSMDDFRTSMEDTFMDFNK